MAYPKDVGNGMRNEMEKFRAKLQKSISTSLISLDFNGLGFFL